jgi:hypothetical protein
MAVRRSQNWLNQQRVDVPHLRSIESAIRNDFDELISSYIIGQSASYVIRGWEINMVGAIGASASSLQMIVENSSLFHGKSTQSGTFFQVASGVPNQTINSTTNTAVQGSFTPSALNYVGIEFSRAVDNSTTAQVFLWNPTNKNEISKTVPLAETLNYKIVVTSSIWAANVLPISIVETDSSNNVLSVEDRRPMLFRLGSGGPNTPNPFYTYPWDNDAEGRTENFWKSTNAVSPFRGGDKQIETEKEWKDAVMSMILEMKGTTYWYSPNAGGSITKLRGDLALLQMTGTGKFTHAKLVPGQINWDSDIYLNYIGSRLSYKILTNPSSTDVLLADNEVAYINIVRGQDVIPNLIFTQGSAVVNSVGAVSWTSSILADDYIKVGSQDDTKYYKVQSVDSASQVTLSSVFLEISTGSGGTQAKYAYGTYQTSPSPTTNRHMFVVDRKDVPFNEDNYWIFMRADNGGSIARAYIRGSSGGELQQGEDREISDNTSIEVLEYIGAKSETDNEPDYTNALASGEAEERIITFPAASALTGGQYFTINSALDIQKYYVWANKSGGASLFSQPGWSPAGPGPLSITDASFSYALQLINFFGNLNLSSIDLQARTVGSPTGSIRMKIYADSSGLPGTLLGTSTTVSIATLTSSYSNPNFVFSSPVALTNLATYHYAIEYVGATIDGSNYVQFNGETIAPPNTQLGFFNGSIWAEAGGSPLQSMRLYQTTVAVDPLVPGLIGIPVALSGTETNLQVAAAYQAVLDANPYFDSVNNFDGSITVNNSQVGASTNAVNVNMASTTVVTTQEGVGSYNNVVVDGENLTKSIKRLDEVVGEVQAALDADPYQENLAVVSGAPANDNEVTGPVTAGTPVTIPLNSRASDIQETFVVGRADLELHLNGQQLVIGKDYVEIGTAGDDSSIVEFTFELKVDDVLDFRKISGSASGGGGGAASGVNLGPSAQGDVFKQTIGSQLQFRRLKSGANITITQNVNDITISSSSGVAPTPTRLVNGANSTIVSTDGTVHAVNSGVNITFTLPDATTVEGQFFYFKKRDSGNTLFIKSVFSQTLDGVDIDAAPKPITLQNESITIQAMGGAYWIV